MKYKLLLLIFLFSNINFSFGQQQYNKTEMALYNIGLGSIFSGIGALINKKPSEKWDKVLFKGMYQGAVGGYLIYESKNLIGKIPEKQKWKYGWGAKFLNSAGTSIIENASSNRNFWEKWHINIGFNRIELYAKNEFKVKYKIMPVSLIVTTVVAFNSKFEINRTLQTGELIFSDNLKDGQLANGISYGNLIVIDNSELNNYNTISHEIIHIYQYYDYNFINSYSNKSFEKFKLKSKTFSKLNDLFYFDLQGPFLMGLYGIENINRKNYYDNFFEYEAGFYSNTIRSN